MTSLIKQKTISKEISFQGISVHSGNISKLKLIPAKTDTGILFIRKDKNKKNVILANWKNISSTKLCTTISNKSGVSISTIEHLMSAISALGIDNLKIEIVGSEVPILDGSAKKFIDKILSIGFLKQEKNKKFIKILKTIKVKNGSSYASLSPSNNDFKISYKLNYDHPLIEKEKYTIKVNKENYKNEIAPARTFGFINDYKKLKKIGFAKGASFKNCIVLNGKKILNNNGLRFKNEFVRHKVLDAIGDLFLSGYSILGQFKGEKSGHETNHQLLKKMFSDKSSFTLVNMSKVPEEDTNIIAFQIPKKVAS